jgi:hypothetical protein
MFLSVPYMSIRLVNMQYWYDEMTFISISDPKPIDGVLVGWAPSVAYLDLILDFSYLLTRW